MEPSSAPAAVIGRIKKPRTFGSGARITVVITKLTADGGYLQVSGPVPGY
jgi:hypothetical protein